MDDLYCPQCRLRQPTDHLFCIACGASLPAHLLVATRAKAARFFPGVKVATGDPESAFLRVSCYLREQHFTSQEGTVVIPGHHVRFSIWEDNVAQCVLSIPETEARELTRFIESELNRLDEVPA